MAKMACPDCGGKIWRVPDGFVPQGPCKLGDGNEVLWP